MEFTEEDWRYLYSLSSTYYRRGKYHPDITKKDFNQICAMWCVKYMHRLPEFRDVKGYIRSSVWYMATQYSVSKYNLTQSTAPRWRRFKAEVPSYSHSANSDDDYSYSEVEYSTGDVYKDSENKLNCEDILVYAKKYLTPLEYNILNSIYNNKTWDQIGHEQHISKKSAYNKWLQVKDKLGNLR